jgi:adenosylcobinamide-GDP ribazoletransferase
MPCTLPLALTFLTKIPWPWRGQADAHALARSMFWYPWVGALLGVIFWGAWWGLSHILPPAAAAAILVALTVFITGGLHLDGLADTLDGLGGGRTPQDRLRIMKDSRVGAFGVMGLILALLLKYSLILGGAAAGWGREIILFPMLSRFGMALLAYLSPYARPEGGLGQAMATGVAGRTVAGATVSALGLAFLAAGWSGLIIMAAAAGLVWLASVYFRRQLGGVTGDVFGAVNEILEVAALAGCLIR